MQGLRKPPLMKSRHPCNPELPHPICLASLIRHVCIYLDYLYSVGQCDANSFAITKEHGSISKSKNPVMKQLKRVMSGVGIKSTDLQLACGIHRLSFYLKLALMIGELKRLSQQSHIPRIYFQATIKQLNLTLPDINP